MDSRRTCSYKACVYYIVELIIAYTCIQRALSDYKSCGTALKLIPIAIMLKFVFFTLLLTIVLSVTCSSSRDTLNDDDEDIDTAILQVSAQKNIQDQKLNRFPLHHLNTLHRYRSRYYNQRMLLSKMKGLVRTYVTRPLIRKLTNDINGQLESAQ